MARIRNAIVLIGMAAVFGLFAARPFFRPEWRELAGVLATLVFAGTFGLILVINKLVYGVYFPGRKNIAERLPRRPHAEGRDPFPLLLWTVGLAGYGLLTVYVLKHYNLSKDELYLGALIGPLILLVLVNGLLYLRRRR